MDSIDYNIPSPSQVASKLLNLDNQYISESTANEVANEIIKLQGRNTARFLEAAKYFNPNSSFIYYAEVFDEKTNLDQIIKLTELIHRKVYPSELQLNTKNPENLVKKLSKMNQVCRSQFKNFNFNSFTSFEEIDSYILVSKFFPSHKDPNYKIVRKEIQHLMNLGHTIEDIEKLFKHRLLKQFSANNIPKIMPLNFDSLDQSHIPLYCSADFHKRLFLNMAFGSEVDIEKLTEKFPDQETSDWWHYVVRKQDWNKIYDNADQKKYGSQMHRAVLIAADGIQEKQWTFYQILSVLSFLRGQMTDNDRYGIFRGIGFTTYLDNTYKELSERMHEMMQNYKGKNIEIIEIMVKTYGNALNEKIPLTLFILWGRKRISHTDPKYLSQILSHVNELYEQALSLSNREQLDKKLGEIFWWICKAKPWERGDPSIAEMLIKAIYQKNGIQPPAWKEGVIPWVEVEATPDVEEFAKNFHTLLVS